jgi:DNA invertase Pin-like site-specific DNA recombinase
MVKAYAYLRVSGRGQIDGDGFERQELAIRKYAKAQGVRVVEWFREEGVSGTKDLDNRPALAGLVEALHADGVKLVLIERLDRLARDLMIQESIVGDFRRKDFELVSVTEPDLCKNEPTRALMRQMLGAFAEYERKMIVSKLSGARQRVKAKTGRCEGRKPYGFFPGEAKVLERMKALRQSGAAYESIATTLNTESLKPRKGEQWHPGVVHRILKTNQ